MAGEQAVGGGVWTVDELRALWGTVDDLCDMMDGQPALFDADLVAEVRCRWAALVAAELVGLGVAP